MSHKITKKPAKPVSKKKPTKPVSKPSYQPVDSFGDYNLVMMAFPKQVLESMTQFDSDLVDRITQVADNKPIENCENCACYYWYNCGHRCESGACIYSIIYQVQNVLVKNAKMGIFISNLRRIDAELYVRVKAMKPEHRYGSKYSKRDEDE